MDNIIFHLLTNIWYAWISEWMSDYCFNANSAVLQLYHGKNKLLFLARYQDNVAEWSNLSIRGMLFFFSELSLLKSNYECWSLTFGIFNLVIEINYLINLCLHLKFWIWKKSILYSHNVWIISFFISSQTSDMHELVSEWVIIVLTPIQQFYSFISNVNRG
jgi:hypothetical protein